MIYRILWRGGRQLLIHHINRPWSYVQCTLSFRLAFCVLTRMSRRKRRNHKSPRSLTVSSALRSQVVVFYIRASYWFSSLSFHDNRASHSWDTILYLENSTPSGLLGDENYNNTCQETLRHLAFWLPLLWSSYSFQFLEQSIKISSTEGSISTFLFEIACRASRSTDVDVLKFRLVQYQLVNSIVFDRVHNHKNIFLKHIHIKAT